MINKKAYTAAVALVVALGGFLLGFDSAVISGAVPFLKTQFGLTDWQLGFGVSCLILGAMFGNAVAGPLSDRFGRKQVLILTAVLFTISALGSALARNYGEFVAARIVCGVAVGVAILIAPVYIAEISPPKQRGMLVSFNQLNIVLGISASYFSNYFVLRQRLGETSWRWMLAVEAIPAVIYFILLFFVPESPRWLLGRGREEEARKVFVKAGLEDVNAALRQIRESFADSESGRGVGALMNGLRALFTRRLRFIMFIALAIAFFQQITGINAILYYATAIFSRAGGGQDASFMQAAIVGLVNLSLTLVALWLIDRLGRKPLLLIGATGMAVSLLTCAWAFHTSNYQLTSKSFDMLQANQVPAEVIGELKSLEGAVFGGEREFLTAAEQRIGAERLKPHREALASAGLNIRAMVVLIAILGFVGCFAISLGPVMWVLLSEIFPNNVRGVAISAVGFWNSVVSFAVTLVFPWEMSTLGPAGVYLVYGVLAVAAVIFVALFIPETKGRSLEELETLLTRGAPTPAYVRQPVPEPAHETH